MDRDVRAQYQADEANRWKKQVSSLKACQLCQSSTHTASSCPNMNQQAIEGYTEEEVHFSKDVYRNPNTSYQPRNVSYSNWDPYAKGEHGPTPNQNTQPYRPPGYQAPVQASKTDLDDLKKLTIDITKHNDQRMDNFERMQRDELLGIKAHIKGVNAHLDD